MGRKKNRTGGEAPVARVVSGKSGVPAASNAEKTVGASNPIIFAMGCAGAVLGFLSGLNHWPSVPAELNTAIASTGWLGAVLGQQHLDYQTAGQGLFLGLSVGLGTSFSFNLPMRKMVMTWILAGGGLLAGALLAKSAFAAAAGWVGGLVLAQLTPA
ncbi:hypothetical protein JST97_27230 [bacterium]|nr:hypothetical protein [bacterium]